MPAAKASAQRAMESLREVALNYPETHEDFPWGERVIKVRKKVFVFLGRNDKGLSFTVKLPESGMAALALPFAEPTGYGLGKSGWVTLSFGATARPPIELLRKFLDESYRAVAPKKLVESLAGKGKK